MTQHRWGGGCGDGDFDQDEVPEDPEVFAVDEDEEEESDSTFIREATGTIWYVNVYMCAFCQVFSVFFCLSFLWFVSNL